MQIGWRVAAAPGPGVLVEDDCKNSVSREDMTPVDRRSWQPLDVEREGTKMDDELKMGANGLKNQSQSQ